MQMRSTVSRRGESASASCASSNTENSSLHFLSGAVSYGAVPNLDTATFVQKILRIADKLQEFVDLAKI